MTIITDKLLLLQNDFSNVIFPAQHPGRDFAHSLLPILELLT